MANTYIVKSGDTLSQIAQKNGITVSALASANNITNPNFIKVGQNLNIGSQTPPNMSIPSSSDIQSYKETVSKLTTPTVPTSNGVKYSTGLNYTPAPVAPVVTPTPTPTPTPTTGIAKAVAGYSNPNNLTVQQVKDIQTKNGLTVDGIIGKQTTPFLGTNGGNPTPVIPTQTPVINPQIKTDANNVDLAKKAGEAGLSVSEYTALMQGQNSVSQAESDAIAKELGITALEGEVFKKPSQSTQQLFQSAYDTSGLSDIKSKILAINEEVNKIRGELTDATGQIDENPFLTEASRVGRGKRVLSQAESKINNKLAQAQTLQDLYDAGITEITGMITRNTNDFGTNQAIDQAHLNYLITKAEGQKTTKASENAKVGTSSYLSSRTSSAKPEVIGTSETGYFRWDTTTKKFVQVISPAKAKTTTEDVLKPTAEQKGLVGRFISTAEGKALFNGITPTASDMIAIYTDPTLFYALLQKANEAGIY